MKMYQVFVCGILLFLSIMLYVPITAVGHETYQRFSFITPVDEVQPTTVDEQLAIGSLPPEATDINCDESWSDTQRDVLRKAFLIGAEHGYPETVQAITYVETRSGNSSSLVGNQIAPVGKRAYGIMQIKVAATRHVFHTNPVLFEYLMPDIKGPLHKIPDEEFIAILLLNDEANILIGSAYFELMQKNTPSWKHAVVAYYTGLEGSKSVPSINEHFYLHRIRSAINEQIRPHNICVGLQS